MTSVFSNLLNVDAVPIESKPSLEVIALNRLTFGLTPDLSAEWQTLGADDGERLVAFVDQQLTPESINDAACNRRLKAADLPSLNKSRRQTWRHYVRRELEDANAYDPFTECQRATFLRATYSKRQLLERVTSFWHDHFSVHGSMSVIASMMMHYDQKVIRPNALGNFRTMLGEVARSTSMLYYLDNYTSSNAGPNENWARELFELHTLGEENYLGSGLQQSEVEGFPDAPIGYVDSDVYEATRCFTGWTISAEDSATETDTGAFYLRDEWHDRFQKTVLGKFIPADQSGTKDGDDILDTLAAHPSTAKFICHKLCKRFISDNPPEALVESAAAIFQAEVAAPDQLKQVLRHILLSNAFQQTWGEKIRRPFEAIVGVLRATGAELTFDLENRPSRNLIDLYDEIGQPLFDWPAPDGYPDSGPYWLNTTSLFKRWRLLNWLVAARNRNEENENEGFVLDLVSQIPSNVRSSEAIVDFLSESLLSIPLASEDRLALIRFMAQGHNPTFELPILQEDDEIETRIRALVALIFMLPVYLYK